MTTQPSAHAAVFMSDIPADEISAMNDTARGLVMTLRGMKTETGDELCKRISDELTPELMFNRGTAPFPSLWAELRKFLVSRNVNLRTHQRHRTIYTIANTIYTDEEENEAAIELAKRILSGKIQTPIPARQNPNPSYEDMGKKIAHNVAMRLKDSDQKFSGDLAECWEDFKDEYDQIAEDYDLDDDQRFRYLHNLLRKDAHRFYLDSVRPNASTYEEAVTLLEKEYNSVVRQTRVKNHLNGLRLTQFINNDTDTAGALAKVYKRILTMSRQVPITHRGDAHKIEFLRTAVVGHRWAKEPLSRVATAGLTFQQLYAELEIAVQLERESADASASNQTTSTPTGALAKIHFSGQGKYIRRPNQQKQQTQRKRACFNCGSESHLVKQCPHPVNFSRAAAGNLRNLRSKRTQNAIHIVLAHLCYELDAPEEQEDGDNQDEGDDVAIFEELLVLDVTDANDDQSTEDIPIFSVQVHFAPTSDDFWGACIDSGAQRTVIGRKQADAYIRQTGDKNAFTRDNKNYLAQFRFGNSNHKCHGILKICMPVADDIAINFNAFVVPIDVPLLLGLDVLQKLEVIIKFGDGTLHSEKDDWSLKLEHKMGHLYVEWPPSIYYTEAELRRIHRHFFHPHTDRLVSLIHRGAKEHAKPGLRKKLEHIRETCDTCQRLAKEPGRFRVAIPNEDCVFNRSVGMDLMKIEKRTVLHVVDRDTKFSAASFLDGETSKIVWETFLSIWVSTYTGYPDEVILDQGPQFQSKEFKSLLSAAGIKWRDAGVESHNSLGETERYHAFLRNIFERVRHEHPNMNQSLILQVAIKACNDTAGPAGNVPTLLVFGVIPRMPIHPEELPAQRDRMNALHRARNHMTNLMARSKLIKASKLRVPNAVDLEINIGDPILVYRDDPGKWVGPYRVIDTDHKSIYIDWDGRLTVMSIDRCKPYKTESSVSPDNDNANDIVEEAIHDSAKDINDDFDLEKSIWDIATDDQLFSEFLVKVLQSNDPRTLQADFIEAKKKEVDGLQKRGTWTKVHKSNIPRNANIVGGRFINTLKNYKSPDEIAKVRYVAQGFADFLKSMLAHDVTSLRPTSIRLILCIAAVLLLRLFLHDVMQAYLQAKDKLTRAVYLNPKPEDRHLFGLLTDYLLKLVKPLYGLCDSGDYWNITIDDHLKHDLCMTKAVSDVSLYFKFKGDQLYGITGNYVDDNINAGTPEFEKETEATLKKFESKPRVYDSFSFFGTQVKTLRPGVFSLSQPHYIRTISVLPKQASITEFRRARSSLAWTLHCRPEYACIVNKSAQVTEKTMTPKHIRELNHAIRDAHNHPDRGLVYDKLDKDSLHLRVYVDASFASNDDMSSQLGFIILLCDDHNRFHVIELSSRKSKRVVRSIMGGELYAFTDAFDAVATIAIDLSHAFRRKIPVRMFTDSKQVFDVITRGKRPTEKRLAIDVIAAREAYHNFEIDRVGLIRGENNPADALSKLAHNGKLHELLDRQVDETPVESWIMRTNNNDNDDKNTTEN